MKLEFNTNLGEKRLDENVEVVLYRVVCELVNNTLKHADAHLIRINMHKDQNKLKLEYSDDGQGFDAEKILTGKRSGMGYSNMISRIRSIKGSYEVISQVGKG